MTVHHDVNGDATVMSETSAICTDSSHSVITGTDAGTDSSGNAYRWLHYDNWNTIIYWCKHDPHVYDKCMKNGCNKAIDVAPTADSLNNSVILLRDFAGNADEYVSKTTGDGYSFIVNDRQWNMADANVTTGKYAQSLIRASLVGADSHTQATATYAGTDATTKYTSSSCLFACLPLNLQNAIVAKQFTTPEDTGLDGIYDKLWLFSSTEMNNPTSDDADAYYGENSFYDVITSGTWELDNITRASHYQWWLRSGDYGIRISDLGGFDSVSSSYESAVAPGFLLPAKSQS